MTGSYVDPNLPVVDQLEMAVAKLKEHIRVILVTRAENKKFKEVNGMFSALKLQNIAFQSFWYIRLEIACQ